VTIEAISGVVSNLVYYQSKVTKYKYKKLSFIVEETSLIQWKWERKWNANAWLALQVAHGTIGCKGARISRQVSSFTCLMHCYT